ncbi:AbiH family protein [Lactiplantibacillus plantarum]|uniref:AbiH family protein n=1 Tax=Lactiplantibacillus plantarum TaxID=1590 RepID=UPI001AAEA906|nr:AbiH family protein [Lactiplantibacillus plantarum]MBO2705794.1 hypothetical protein [Lactiplantibacillus plantarum]MDN7038272.1 hypothetical protein [Lactiplantibacillus plantarum]MDO7795364.1 AbiH family protein [Lactiplantibacillus plantarum]WVI00468.1 AbiH family protein [Lactiplantibacillus plantarum]
MTDVPKLLKKETINWSDIESVIEICSLTLDDCLKDKNSKNAQSYKFKEKFELICFLIQAIYPEHVDRIELIQSFKKQKLTAPQLQVILRQSIKSIEYSFESYLIHKQLKPEGCPDESHLKVVKEKLFNNPENTVVLDFNYTKIDRKLDTDRSLKTIHPHGSLKKHNLIFGINSTIEDKLINENSGSFQLTKTFRGLLNQTLSTEEPQPMLPTEVNELTFFGHSLNTSDYDYFYSLFDY